MTYLLAAIASVSLLVGGIGIMNIMLVSVTERTREIGLRMAVGARARDILTQFLVEAVTLSLIGGVIGIALGVGGSNAISTLAEWRTVLAPSAILLAFGFAAAIGIFFGFYPARKASRLDPIEALRYE
jgi:putative ABC transport system permease protein